MTIFKREKPVISSALAYPDIIFTESTRGHGSTADKLGLGDSKRFYDRWIAYVKGCSIALETIKLMRYCYAWGYYNAIDDVKNKRGNLHLEIAEYAKESAPKKTYTPKEMQNAYMEGVRRGLFMWKVALEDTQDKVADAYKEFSDVMNERAKSEDELIIDADIIAKECDCVSCRKKRGEPIDNTDKNKAVSDVVYCIEKLFGGRDIPKEGMRVARSDDTFDL